MCDKICVELVKFNYNELAEESYVLKYYLQKSLSRIQLIRCRRVLDSIDSLCVIFITQMEPSIKFDNATLD
jgi:hypothetical protein